MQTRRVKRHAWFRLKFVSFLKIFLGKIYILKKCLKYSYCTRENIFAYISNKKHTPIYPCLHFEYSISSVRRQKGLTGYCFKYTDRPFCLQANDLSWSQAGTILGRCHKKPSQTIFCKPSAFF